jgi:23S rRNA pseudouridine1911/1915/1917 synthase
MEETAFENYHVASQQAGLALVAALRHFRPEAPWSAVRRLVQNRHVQVNGNLCLDEGRRLRVGDVVKVWREPRAALPKAEDVNIVYQDHHLVVVEKPAGVTTVRHPEERLWPQRRKQVQPTLDEMVTRILARKLAGKARGKQVRPPRVRLVHRLDRDTSGVMVLATSAEAERRLVHMFRKHDVQRIYQAICIGRVEEQTFQSFLVRDRGDRRRGSTTLPDTGKRAVTHVRPLEHFDGYTFLECRLETGRTHQIRIHLAEAGHPVCGEKVYNKLFRGYLVPDHSGAQRQMLHAVELGFDHPISGETLHFQMPMPADMARLLAGLRGKLQRGGASDRES